MPRTTLTDALTKSILLRAQLSSADEAIDHLLAADTYLEGSAPVQSALWHRSGREDVAYTKQYFTIGRQAHVRSTQSVGAPALVWHVAFWPRRSKDPQDLNGQPRNAGNAGAEIPLTRQSARQLYDNLRGELAKDLDELLVRLQMRGRVPQKKGPESHAPRAPRIERFGKPVRPLDWETRGDRPQTPVKAFAAESISFTLWWGDPIEGRNRATCPDTPPVEDVRVRVQADIHADFAAVTFIIDASKAWSQPTFDVTGTSAVPGSRRTRIFDAARSIRAHADGRLKDDSTRTAELLPETGVTEGEAQRLLDASRLLYRDIWDEFCDAFDCRLTDIAGETDKVFANFRGVILAAPGNPEDKGHLSRFVYGDRNVRGNLDVPYPQTLVKAYWPFIRRTRSEADYRDWIACGVFDWRALYITALGGQSDFDPGDETSVTEAEGEHRISLAAQRADTRMTPDIPAGHLPQRSLEDGGDIAAVQHHLNGLEKSGDDAVRSAVRRLKRVLRLVDSNGADLSPAGWEPPKTVQHDRPAPFHYLLLATDDLDRRQVGRMVDRVNLLGTVRLYAMKNFSIIRDADVHLRIYGQLLDQIMGKATEETDEALKKWWTRAYADARANLTKLWGGDCDREISKNAKLFALRSDANACIEALQLEEAKIGSGTAVTERPLMLYRRLLADMVDAAPRAANLAPGQSSIFARAKELLKQARGAKSRHDENLAQLNRQTDLRLHQVKTHIDELGHDAIGGLPFRINRAHFYAEMYRAMVRTLRVGSIDTWWDYEQLASRGVDPPLRFIENVGERLEKLRTRLRDAMEAVQTSAIANQTEATRDNTYQLEAIAGVIGEIETGFATFKKRMYAFYILVLIATAIAGAVLNHLGIFTWLSQLLLRWLRTILEL